MSRAKETAAHVFAEHMRVSRQGGVVKSAAIDVIAEALEAYAAERGPAQARGIRPELLAFSRLVEQTLRTYTDEDGYRRLGASRLVDDLRRGLDEVEEELTNKVPVELARKLAKLASTAFILADNADAFADVPLLERDRFSRFQQSGGAEFLAQLFHEARQEIVVEPINRRTWEETGETTRKNLVAVCAAVLDALDEEADVSPA